jgi:hypothetical protein
MCGELVSGAQRADSRAAVRLVRAVLYTDTDVERFPFFGRARVRFVVILFGMLII